MGEIATLEAGENKMWAAKGEFHIYEPPLGQSPPYYYQECLTKSSWLNNYTDSYGSTFVISGTYADNECVDIDHLSYKYIAPGVYETYKIRFPVISCALNNFSGGDIRYLYDYSPIIDDLQVWIYKYEDDEEIYEKVDAGPFHFGDKNGKFTSTICGDQLLCYAGRLPQNNYFIDGDEIYPVKNVTAKENTSWEAYICTKIATFNTTSTYERTIFNEAISRFNNIYGDTYVKYESFYGNSAVTPGRRFYGNCYLQICGLETDDYEHYYIYDQWYLYMTVGEYVNGTAKVECYLTSDSPMNCETPIDNYDSDECNYTWYGYIYENAMTESEWYDI